MLPRGFLHIIHSVHTPCHRVPQKLLFVTCNLGKHSCLLTCNPCGRHTLLAQTVCMRADICLLCILQHLTSPVQMPVSFGHDRHLAMCTYPPLFLNLSRDKCCRASLHQLDQDCERLLSALVHCSKIAYCLASCKANRLSSDAAQ